MREEFSITRILLYVFLVSTVMGVALFSFAYKYKNQIAGRAIQEIGRNTGLTIQLGRSSISIFKTYPIVTFELTNILIKDKVYGDTLANLDRIILSFDYKDISAGKYDVKYAEVDGGYVKLVRKIDGNANYNIDLKQNINKSENFNLEKLSFKNTALVYSNRVNGTNYEALARDIRMKLDYNKEIVSLGVNGNIFLHVATLDSNTFLRDKSLTVNGKLTYDFLLHEMAITPSQVKLEGTSLDVEGSLDFANDKNLDLSISSEETVFNNLLALAPSDNQNQLGNYNAQGSVYMNARLKGKIARGRNPEIEIDFGCLNTNIKRVDQDVSLDSLNLIGHFTNGSKRNFSTAQLQIKGLNFRIGDEIVAGSFSVEDFNEPTIQANLKGSVDVRRLFAFADPKRVHEAAGSVKMDLSVDGKIRQYAYKGLNDSGFNTNGYVRLRNVRLNLTDYQPSINKLNGIVRFRNNRISVPSLKAKVGKTDFSFEGEIKKQNKGRLLGGKLKLDASIFSKNFYASELLEVSGTNNENGFRDVQLDVVWDINPLNPFQLKIANSSRLSIERLAFRTGRNKPLFKTKDLEISIGQGNLSVPSFFIEGGNSKLSGSVVVKRFTSWWKRNSIRCRINFDFKANQLDMSDFSSIEESSTIANLKLKGYIFSRLQDLRTLESIPYAKLQIPMMEFDAFRRGKKLASMRIDCRVSGKELRIRELSGLFGGQQFFIKGALQNYQALLSNKEEQTELTLFYKSPKLNVNRLIADFESSDISDLSIDTKNKFGIRHLNVQVGKLSYEKVALKDFFAKGSFEKLDHLVIDTAYAKSGKGFIQLKGDYSLNDQLLTTHLYANRVRVKEFFNSFDKISKGLVLEKNIDGLGDFDLKAKAKVRNASSLDFFDIDATINSQVENGQISNFPPFKLMGDYFRNPSLEKISFDSLQNLIVVKNDVLQLRALRIKKWNGQLFITNDGVDKQELSYKVGLGTKILNKVPISISRKFPTDYRGFLTSVETSDGYRLLKDSDRMLFLKISGTLSDYSINFIPAFDPPKSISFFTFDNISVKNDSLQRVSMNY